jgi:hypothetical protein
MAELKMRKIKLDKIFETELMNSECTAAYLNGVDRWIYVSNETNPANAPNTFRDGMNAINIDDFNKVLELQDKGKLTESEYKDKIRYGIFNSKDGWDEKAKVYQANAAAVAAGGASVPDYSGIEVSAMTAIIYGMQERSRVLQNALRVVDIEGTKYEYPELTGRVSITRDITYGGPIPVKSGQFKNRSKDLKCDAAHFQMFDDVNYRPRSVDVMRANLELIGAAFVRDTADQVQEIIADSTITVITGTNWTTSTNNPYIDLAKAAKVIEENNGRADKVAIHDMTLAAHAGNPNTKTLMDTSAPPQYGAKTLGGALYAGMETFVDNSMHLQKATVWDSFYVPLVRGPRGTAMYRDTPHFSNGWLTFEWKKLFLADLTKIRILDSLNAFT